MATASKILRVLMMTTLITVLLGCCCSATIHKVGDSSGWTAKDDTYYEWTKGKEFHVGDFLVFQYDQNINDVIQVPGALEYEFCDSSSPKAVYTTGIDVVTLTEPGYHYFITSNHGQCSSGQKLDVLVVYDPSRLIPPPPPSNDNLPSGKLYKVGDSTGWSVPEGTDYYHEWGEEKQIHVGDNLLFEYDLEVNEDVLKISGDLDFIYSDPA